MNGNLQTKMEKEDTNGKKTFEENRNKRLKNSRC